MRLVRPLDYEVFQRADRGTGQIRISGTVPENTTLMEARVEGGEWTTVFLPKPGQSTFEADLPASAGGWYRLEVRAKNGDEIVAEGAIPHVGVGEVFVVAGQSNAANHGAEKQVTRTGRVSSFDGKAWHLANDPQPGASGGGGSFLPPFGDAIAEQFRVPVGIVATGVGATSVREWLPKGARFPNPPTLTGNVTELPGGEWESKGVLFSKFVERLKPLGPQGFRAVLWHQGESDANQKDASRTLSGELYAKFLEQLIRDSRKELGWEVPWFVALASYHTPDDAGSPEIRAAQKALWRNGVAHAGPDTDALAGAMRDSDGKGVHFSGPGLRAHAAAWVEKVAPWLEARVMPVKVFILAGQSNMEGQGVVAMDDPKNYNGGKGNLVWSMEHSASKERMRHLRDAEGKWVVRDDVEISFKAGGKVRKGGLTIGYTGYGGSTHIGPELQFGHVIGDDLDSPVLLIKTAWGGKSLHVDFRPPSSGGVTGEFYQQMIAEVREALKGMGAYELAGFVWMQGWNDMVSAEATAEYAENLIHLARDLRAEFNAPALPFVVGELGNGGPAREGSGMAAFREAQKRGTAEIPNAVFVPTADFARPAEMSPNVGHGHHWFGNAESYFLVGDALGRAMIELLEEPEGGRKTDPAASGKGG